MRKNGRDFNLAKGSVTRLTGWFVVLLVSVGTLGAVEPLSREDVMLIALSGAATQKKVQLIQTRGIGFPMSAETAKQIRQLGADESVLCAIQHASVANDGLHAANTTPPSLKSAHSDLALPAAAAENRVSSFGCADLQGHVSAAVTPSKLADPPQNLIARIVAEFLRKDEALRNVLKNYNYRQLVTVKQLDNKRQVVGSYHREWDLVFDDRGSTISRVAYAAPGSLKRIHVNDDEAQSFNQAMFPTEVGKDYDFGYLGHVRLDKITAYAFSARPKKIEPGRRYFEGMVWVEDQDLQVVKVDGRRVPALKKVERGIIHETLFPHFVEYRQQVDGTYWFPIADFSDDTLQFAFGPVHVQVLVKYSDYRPFGAESHIMVSMSRLIFNQDANQDESGPGTPKQ